MEWLILILLGVIMAVIVAIIANSRGRNAGGWFVYGLLIWPIALVHVLVAEREGRAPCPYCAERVKVEASVCPYCQRDLPQFRRYAGRSVP